QQPGVLVAHPRPHRRGGEPAKGKGEGGDKGEPVVLAAPESPSAVAILDMARTLAGKGRGLAGMQLGLTPSGRL
ncbi:MAG TPA: hypothetical protein PLO27_08425, partial [Marmoricola sp.]|nr:hypothetical protein [Marmoricola sp.]